MHFKHIFFFVALFGLVTLGFAEQYNVLHVKGEIRLEKTKTQLKPGDVINSEDKVIFGSPDALAALFSPSKGRFTLSSTKKGDDFGDEFVAYVKSNLFPAKKGLSTRAAGMLKNEIELEQHFSKENYLVLGTTKIRISPDAYPMKSNAFFYLRFEYEGEEVNKQLLYEGDALVLSAEHILQVDNQAIKAEQVDEYHLFYYDAASTVSQRICEFTPVFPEEEMMISSLELMIKGLKSEGKTKEEIRSEIDGFVAEYYGNADAEALTEWLSVNLAF